MEPMHFISLGAGVQSSTMALMAACGEIEPMPKAAIFADTQAEPEGVYRWLEWLEKQLPFPVHKVTFRNITDEALILRKSKDGRTISRTDIPFHMLAPDGSVGRIVHRSCTRDYKIYPITKAVRKLAKVKRGEKENVVCQWIGISLDERMRMKPSRDKWSEHRWPLIEKRMTRGMCLEWMTQHGFPEPPRSACVFCPFHSNSEWRRLQTKEPEEFAKAVEFEKAVQAVKAQTDNMTSVPYLHPSCKPLETIDFRGDVERGQGLLWQDECEGMCGV